MPTAMRPSSNARSCASGSISTQSMTIPGETLCQSSSAWPRNSCVSAAICPTVNSPSSPLLCVGLFLLPDRRLARCRVHQSKTLFPAAVSASPFRSRWNRLTPSSPSRSWICLLKGGCETCSRSAPKRLCQGLWTEQEFLWRNRAGRTKPDLRDPLQDLQRTSLRYCQCDKGDSAGVLCLHP
jgi:hypothetical protein